MANFTPNPRGRGHIKLKNTSMVRKIKLLVNHMTPIDVDVRMCQMRHAV